MNEQPRMLFWFELGLSILSAAALVLSVLSPQWIESFLDFEPDGGDGSSEWGVTVSLLLATIVLAALTTRTWRRARSAGGI